MQPLAIYSVTAYNTIEVLEIVNNFIRFRWINGGERTKTHRAKIKQDNAGNSYFNTYNLRIKLNDCIRVVP